MDHRPADYYPARQNDRKFYEKRLVASKKVKPGEKPLSRLNFLAKGPRRKHQDTAASHPSNASSSVVASEDSQQGSTSAPAEQQDVTMKEPASVPEGASS